MAEPKGFFQGGKLSVAEFEFKCDQVGCGNKITQDDVKSHPHKNGIKGQWVYFTCTKCGYKWSWWKIERRLQKVIVREN